MSNKIFKSSFFTSMLVLAISFFMVFSILFNHFEKQVFSELESEAEYIAYVIEINPENYLSGFKNKSKRITLISPDGTVIEDTVSDAESLENHANRKEFKDAKLYGSGKSERYSNTLSKKMLYYAVKLKNGNILRICATQNSVVAILMGLLQPLICIIAIALAFSLILSYKVSNSIIKPINSLDLDNPEINKAYDELSPLLKKITAQNKIISRQIKDAEKSREEFRLICENMNEGFLVIDKDARILSYNSAALNLLEIKDIEKNNILNLNRKKDLKEVIKKSLNGSRTENTMHLKEKTYNLIANPVRRNEKTIGAVVVIIDITESAKRELLRQEFTSNVSHELKTPLTSISGFAEIMKSGDTPPGTVIDFSNAIYEEAGRLITLVGDIIKLSELDEKSDVFSKENVDLLSLSQNIANRLEPVAKKGGISMHVSGTNTYVNGNEKILDEMIYNLCDNAIKYNNPGGSVNICVTKTANGAALSVRDTGIGIEKTEQDRIFERFYRVDKSRSKSAGGTGLGLAIVKHGAIHHNAKISLESETGKGTSITIAFI